jgi:hypothetical protein
MAQERKWTHVAQSLTANGNQRGIITVADVAGFYVKQAVVLSSATMSPTSFEIKRIDGTTDIHVGPKGSIDARADVSGFLVIDGAVITAFEQAKVSIKKEDQDAATYETSPILARRVIPVDQYGKFYSNSNPLPTTGGGGSSSGGLAPANFDDVKIIRNSSGDPIQYQLAIST